MQPLRHVALLLALGTLLFSLNLGGYDIAAPDEPRYAHAAREMMRTGDYVVPRVNGETYLEKPPLLFWSMAAASWPVGDVTAVTARIPSIVSGLVTVVFTYALAYHLFGARVAFWAALILMTTARVWWQARFGQIDMLLTALLTASLYALWRWEEDRRPAWLLVVYGGMGLGLLAKGPPALMFPLLLIAAFYWRNPEARRGTWWLTGTLAALALALAWFVPARLLGAETTEAAVQGGIAENLWRNTIGRALLGVSKAQPPWYYLTTIPVDLLPWALFLPWTLPWVWRNHKRDKGMWFLWCYTVPALIVFSIIVGKRAIYILPLFPAFAIFLGASIVDLAEDPKRWGWRRNTGIAWGVLLALLGLALIGAGTLSEYHVYATPGVLGFAGALAALGVVVLVRSWQRDGQGVQSLFAGTAIVLFGGAALFALPVANQFKSAVAFCEPVRTLAHAGEEFSLYSVGFSRETYIFHADHFHEERFTDLIEIPELAEQDWMAAARFQISARKAIADAVEDVPVADFEAVTEAELAALRTAIEETVRAKEAADDLSLRLFEAALRREVADFEAAFARGPSFMFVQTEDWRWLLPFYDEPPDYEVLRHDGVGSREVLLLANEAGAELWAAYRADQSAGTSRRPESRASVSTNDGSSRTLASRARATASQAAL